MNIIWSKNNCIYCTRAKKLFEYKGLEYEERNVDGEDWTLEQMNDAVPTARSFPQIFIGEKYVGGYQELITHFAVVNISL